MNAISPLSMGFLGTLGTPELLIWAILNTILFVIPFWLISKKAGLNPIYSLTGLIPLLNFAYLYYLALITWPGEDAEPRTAEDRAEELLKRGLRAERRLRFEVAKTIYREVLEQFPESQAALDAKSSLEVLEKA